MVNRGVPQIGYLRKMRNFFRVIRWGRLVVLPAGMLIVVWTGCTAHQFISMRKGQAPVTSGTDFFKTVTDWHWQELDSLAVRLILSGDVPKVLQEFVRIRHA